MNKTWIVISREYAQVVQKKSFWVGIFLTPLLMATFVMLPALLADTEPSSSTPIAILDSTGEGLGAKFEQAITRYELEDSETPTYRTDTLVELAADDPAYAETFTQLKADVADNRTKYLLVLKPDVINHSDSAFLVTTSESFKTTSRFRYRLRDIFASKRLEMADVNLPVDSILSLTRSFDLEVQNVKGESTDFGVKYLTAIVFVMILFGMIFGYGQLVMRSVIEEKNSRVMEVLLSSVSPFELMLGKILGLGAAALTQVAIWAAAGVGLYFAQSAIPIDAEIGIYIFNPIIFGYAAIFLIFGYLMYSTLFALVGSIASSDKDAQPFVMPLTMSILLPVMVAIKIVQEPEGMLATVLGYFPLFAPTMTVLRLVSISPDPATFSFFSGIGLQATLALLIVIVSTALFTWLAARIFRIGVLMYGKRPNLPELMKWIKQP